MFSDADRLIYSPRLDGVELGRFDPLAVRRKLVVASGGELNALLDAWEAGRDAETVAAAEAEEKLVAASRKAFGLAGIESDGGVCDADALAVLVDFLEFLAKKDEPQSGLPTTSRSAEPAG